MEDIYEIGKKKGIARKNPFPKSPSKSKPSSAAPKKSKQQKKLEEKIQNSEIEMKAKNELDDLEPASNEPSISDQE